jgi:LacI family transcriptional regulator
MEDDKRVNLKDIAKAVGCSPITVSRALRNFPNVTAELKKRIKAAAMSLGYRPDPALGALVAYRIRTRPATFRTTVALLVPEARKQKWIQTHYNELFYRSLKEYAEQQGYAIDLIETPDNTAGQRRLERILISRGIHGIVLAPGLMNAESFAIDHSRFAFIQCPGYAVRHYFHVIIPNAYLDASRVLEEVQKRGYHRPALVMGLSKHTPHFSMKRVIFEAALLELGLSDVKKREFFYSLGSDWYRSDLPEWLGQIDVDVIVTDTFDWILPHLAAAKIEIPKRCGFVSFSLPDASSQASGILVDVAAQSRLCIDLLHSQLQRGECGIPASPVSVEIAGIWHEGRTLLPKKREPSD